LVSYFFLFAKSLVFMTSFFFIFLFFQSSLNLSLHDIFSCHALFGFLITTGTCSHQLFNLLHILLARRFVFEPSRDSPIPSCERRLWRKGRPAGPRPPRLSLIRAHGRGRSSSRLCAISDGLYGGIRAQHLWAWQRRARWHTRTTEQGATWYVGYDHSNYDALTTELGTGTLLRQQAIPERELQQEG